MVDILAIGVHPDDIELNCSGTLLHQMAQGSTVAIVDMTKGELGTRGNAVLRLKEAKKAAQILGVKYRENLGMADGWFRNTKENQLKVIQMIRKYRPKVLICNAIKDRHPDHGRASELVSEAAFYAGLSKISTKDKGKVQLPWRPLATYHAIQDRYIKPDFLVDITPYHSQKMESILAYGSQVYQAGQKGPETPISGKSFLLAIDARMRDFGRVLQVDFAEGFTVERSIGVKNLLDLI